MRYPFTCRLLSSVRAREECTQAGFVTSSVLFAFGIQTFQKSSTKLLPVNEGCKPTELIKELNTVPLLSDAVLITCADINYIRKRHFYLNTQT
jgi:hypothetical protein